MKSDIICINETWMEWDPVEEIDGYESFYLNKGSKGTAVLTRLKPENVSMKYTERSSHIMISYPLFDLISVYRFADNKNINKFTEDMEKVISKDRPTVLLGDINCNILKQPDNAFTMRMMHLGFKQLQSQISHIAGGILDHIYVNMPASVTYTNMKLHPLYYSDHCAASLILHFENSS